MIIGIDAANISSGGGLTNLIELINGLDISQHKIEKIILWSSLRKGIDIGCVVYHSMRSRSNLIGVIHSKGSGDTTTQ